MTLVSDSHALVYEPLSALLIRTILGAFTILTAFSIRDSVIQGIALVTPDDLTKKFIFTLLMTFFFLFLTILMAFLFQDYIDSKVQADD